MVDNFELVIPEDYFDKIKVGTINLALRVNNSKVKKYVIGNVLTLKKMNSESEFIRAEISNLYYFETIKDALDNLGKSRFGYSNSVTADKIEDKLLSYYKNEEILKNGIVCIEIKVL